MGYNASSTQSVQNSGKTPRGAARDMIRATLNLPPGHRIGKIEARQAVLMALMGSCQANSLAKLLHAHMPNKMARDLRSLVEDNCITVRKGNTLINIPLHPYVREASAEKELAVTEDGCLPDGSPLRRVPGLQAALKALGVPPEEMEEAVASALNRMKLQGEGNSLSCLKIIENIAQHGTDSTRAEKRTAVALDAFAGMEHARLLSAWESTFASAAHNSVASRHRDKLRKAVIHGTGSNGKPDPSSLAAKAAQYQTRLASVDQRYKSEAVDEVRHEFLAQLDGVMDERLQLSFGSGKPAFLVLGPPLDEPPNQAMLSHSIASDGEFKWMMKQLLQHAANRTSEILRQFDDINDLSQQALKLFSESLTTYIDKPGYNDFLRNVALQFLPEGASIKEEEVRPLAWKLSVGRQLVELAEIYFGKSIKMTSSEKGYPPNPDQPQDATHVMTFVLDTIKSMRDDIQAEVERSPYTFHVPVAIHDQVFSLTPATFIDDWSGHQSAAEWIDNKLKAPAHAHVLAPRSEPPLGDLLSHVVTLVDRHKGDFGVPQMRKEQLMHTVKRVDDDGAYTLQAVYEAMSAPGVYLPTVDTGRLFDCLASAILQVEPPHTIQIADTHMESPTSYGGTDRLGALHNPFRHTINIHIMDDLNDGHAPVRQEWLENPWHIMTTPLHDTDERAAALE